MLKSGAPSRIRQVDLPRRTCYYPSSPDWQNEVLYFLLVDRFSDAREDDRKIVTGADRGEFRRMPESGSWNWMDWAKSGASRWQGGTITGIRSKLGYLKSLGITTIWVSPVFKQRAHDDSYHGYAIQDFLEVDPRVGTRADLVELVADAHDHGLRVILDIIFNHSGTNWIYANDSTGGIWRPHYTRERHRFGSWLGRDGSPIERIVSREDGVWPEELQNPLLYTRAGAGDLGAGDLQDISAEHKRSDFISLRDFDLETEDVLENLARCFKYWIALTDCDGFRLDTLKHVSTAAARRFCSRIKEFAANLGKADFFLVGEIAGGDYFQDVYLDVLERNLNAALDIGEMRTALTDVALGRRHPVAYFHGFDPRDVIMGSHRNIGRRHVSILDDHDHVFGDKIRFAAQSDAEHHVVAGVAIQLFTLGIPCIYYGTEQSLAGPEPEERGWLPYWGGADYYLREAMFGPEHPRRSGLDGLAPGGAGYDPELPGFGPFGTRGAHCFDEAHSTFRRIQALATLRARLPVLRVGRQYLRPTSFVDKPFGVHGPGELLAWSRILDDEEAVCVVNTHGSEARGARVLVDGYLNPPETAFEIMANTSEFGARPRARIPNRSGSAVKVLRENGRSFIELENVPGGEVIVLCNHP